MSEARNRRRIAEARLARVLPLAIAEAKRGDFKAEQLTAVALGMMRHVAPDNLAAIHITRGQYGGWCCDIRLREVPAGIPNGYGTPVRYPHATEAEAEAAAVPLLAMGLAAGEQARASTPPPRVFDYFGLECTMPEPVLRFMEEVNASRPDLRWGSPERARDELDAMTERYFPGGKPTEDRFNALAQEDKAWIYTKFGFAMLEGLFRYPDWRAEPPGKYQPPGPG